MISDETLQAIAIVALLLAGGFWVLARILSRREQSYLPPGTLVALKHEPRQPSLGLRDLEWRSSRPHATVAYLLATLSFAVFTVTALVVDGNLLLLPISAAVLVTTLYLERARVLPPRASIRMTRALLDVRSGTVARSWRWQEVTGLAMPGDLALLRVFDASTAIDIDLRGMSAEQRKQIARTLLEHLESHSIVLQELAAPPTVQTTSNLRRAVDILHVLLFLFGGAVATEVIDGRGEPNVLGLRCTYSSRYLQEQFGLPDVNGCVVLRVIHESAAEKAGFKQGDLIVRLDDVPITSGDQFSAVFRDNGNRNQTYRVVRAGQGEVEIDVRLSYPGEAPVEDPNDPFFYYLRARSADRPDLRQADFDRVLELAPDFELALAYRGIDRASPLAFEADPQGALADFDRALALDPNAEVYRSRARAHLAAGRTALARDDIQTVLALDECDTAFRQFNYDCYENYYLLSRIESIESNFEESAQAAVTATEFYTLEASAHFQAARVFWLIEDYASGRRHAARYLDLVGVNGDEINKDWARGLLAEAPEDGELQRPDPSERPPTIFLEDLPRESASSSTATSAGRTLTNVRLASRRTSGPPPAETTFSAEQGQVWLYFEFENAQDILSINYTWAQGDVIEYGHTLLYGRTEGAGWAALANHAPGVSTEGVLNIEVNHRADGAGYAEQQYISVRFVAEPELGAGAFYADSTGTEPVVFYDGQGPLYLRLPYTHATLATEIVWQAELDTVPVGQGLVTVDAVTGIATIDLTPPTPLKPGVLRVFTQLGDARRSAWLSVVSPEVSAAPPFSRFITGSLPGISFETKEFGSTAPAGFALEGLDFSAYSDDLRIAWYQDGRPIASEAFSSNELTGETRLEGIVPIDGAPGEVGVLISIGDRVVHADVFVIHGPPGLPGPVR